MLQAPRPGSGQNWMTNTFASVHLHRKTVPHNVQLWSSSHVDYGHKEKTGSEHHLHIFSTSVRGCWYTLLHLPSPSSGAAECQFYLRCRCARLFSSLLALVWCSAKGMSKKMWEFSSKGRRHFSHIPLLSFHCLECGCHDWRSSSHLVPWVDSEKPHVAEQKKRSNLGVHWLHETAVSAL